MSQHDFTIANQTASSARTDINNALQALASCNSGASAPSTTYANMFWYETDTNILKMRNEANDTWVNLLYVDQSNNLVHILDDTEVVNTSGTKVGVLGDHSDATWTTGTNTEKRLVSPAQLKSAVAAQVSGVGIGQTWQDVASSRAVNTSYQNTTGKPIMANIAYTTSTTANIQVSTNNSTWVTVSQTFQSGYHPVQSVIIPDDHYYKLSGTGLSALRWVELR